MYAEKALHRLFKAGVLLKGAFAALDITAALVAYVVGTTTVLHFVIGLSRGELAGDPDDFLASIFLQLARQFSPDMRMFALIYLLGHGLINAVFVAGLLQNKTWSYPFAIVGMSTFVVYQLFRLSLSFSAWLAVVTVFDVAVILLVAHEYRHKRKYAA
jgi:uncharacterized membrane protein